MDKKEESPVPVAVQGIQVLAEKEGFEPSRPFRGLHDFQSCALDQLGDFSIVVDCSADAIVPFLSTEEQ